MIHSLRRDLWTGAAGSDSAGSVVITARTGALTVTPIHPGFVAVRTARPLIVVEIGPRSRRFKRWTRGRARTGTGPVLARVLNAVGNLCLLHWKFKRTNRLAPAATASSGGARRWGCLVAACAARGRTPEPGAISGQLGAERVGAGGPDHAFGVRYIERSITNCAGVAPRLSTITPNRRSSASLKSAPISTLVRLLAGSATV